MSLISWWWIYADTYCQKYASFLNWQIGCIKKYSKNRKFISIDLSHIPWWRCTDIKLTFVLLYGCPVSCLKTWPLNLGDGNVPAFECDLRIKRRHSRKHSSMNFFYSHFHKKTITMQCWSWKKGDKAPKVTVLWSINE